MKDNKLIAEFMGADFHERSTMSAVSRQVKYQPHISELKYHTSWDWLMPVVEKCYTSNMQYPNDDITQGLIDVDIKATYQAVVEFIKQN
tara:strand:- start:649 stop:915 length:267 start_codon:yes stop_codon:yes gene_type:complete